MQWCKLPSEQFHGIIKLTESAFLTNKAVGVYSGLAYDFPCVCVFFCCDAVTSRHPENVQGGLFTGKSFLSFQVRKEVHILISLEHQGVHGEDGVVCDLIIKQFTESVTNIEPVAEFPDHLVPTLNFESEQILGKFQI